MTKPRLGTGRRFKELERKLARRKGIKNPEALAAAIGRKKYGERRFEKLEREGKRREKRGDPPKHYRPLVHIG